MAIIKVGETYDTGSSHRVQIDAGRDGSIVALSSEHMSFVSRLEEDGSEVLLVPSASFGQFASGYVETLSDGRYALYTTNHFGLGYGSRVQILNRDGSAATEVINPMFEDEDRNGVGYTLTATNDGGFAFVWNDVSRSGDSFELSYPRDPNNGATSSATSAGYDVRVRYFDSTGTATAPSVVADDDVESVNGGTTSRRALDQYINDSQTLAGGGTALVYVDHRWVGKPGGGAQAEYQLSLQVSMPGNVGEPVKIDLGPLGTQFGEYPDSLTPEASANIVALPDGTFAVIWTENTYVAANVWGGYSYTGTQTVIRYFSAAGEPLTDQMTIVTRGTDHGNHGKYVWAEALSDGRIAIGYNVGISGVNGNGTLDAFVGVIGPLGSSLQTTRINETAAANTQFYTISDLAVRSDDTIELVFQDVDTGNHTVVERFAVGDAGEVVGNGSAVAEAIYGKAHDDVIFGLGGNDRLFGQAGRDSLHGGAGNDRLVGGLGDDRLLGGAGNDLIEGQAGADVMDGGAGLDTLVYALSEAGVQIRLDRGTATGGEAAGDRFTGFENVVGSAWKDVLVGDAAANGLQGRDGNDLLNGLGGNDVLSGELGNDIARGDAGEDALSGGDGADRLYGGEGNDSVWGDGGRDTLYGDAGADKFIFRNGDIGATITQADSIMDFDRAAGDKIVLRQMDADTRTEAAGDQDFAFIGTKAFSGAAGELRFEVLNGDAFLQGDTDGDGQANFFIRVDDMTSLIRSDIVA
jgi:Ca2+-binding RTX toxin-like protein